MSFLKSLFSFGKSSAAATEPPLSIEHKGYTIFATPMIVGREFQVCGLIKREVEGQAKEHQFIRVDKLPTREDCNELIFRKGQQMIDQMGDRVFG